MPSSSYLTVLFLYTPSDTNALTFLDSSVKPTIESLSMQYAFADQDDKQPCIRLEVKNTFHSTLIEEFQKDIGKIAISPSIVVLDRHGKPVPIKGLDNEDCSPVYVLEGCHVQSLYMTLFAKLNQVDNSSALAPEDRVKRLIESHDLFMFIKGTPAQPQCKFTRELIGFLLEHNNQNAYFNSGDAQKPLFGFFNILQDDELRTAAKNVASWPTFPMIFWKGGLVGGLDVVKTNLNSKGTIY